MTAFANFDADAIDWQIRTVNHRFLDLSFHLPDALRNIEPGLRERAKQSLRRGKLDAVLRLRSANAEATLDLDRPKLLELLAIVEQVRRDAPATAPADPIGLLRWPGVVVQPAAAAQSLRESAQAGFEQALRALVQQRRREGAKLEAILLEQLDGARATAQALRALAANGAHDLRERLRRRVEALATEQHAERLEMEVALLAQKADATEELDRLAVHLQACLECINAPGPHGRRLDFLLQELLREANTLAAKAIGAESATRVVDLKVAIEQMREQAQNVE